MQICIEKAYYHAHKHAGTSAYVRQAYGYTGEEAIQEQPAAHKNTSTRKYGMFGGTSIQPNIQASEQKGTQREKADGYRHKGETVKQTWKFT